MLSLYVDGDGYCFVSIPTLADDTELSRTTVRNRLAWLEEIGAIAGCRNGSTNMAGATATAGQAHQRPDPADDRRRS
jgi:hypothetical protein